MDELEVRLEHIDKEWHEDKMEIDESKLVLWEDYEKRFGIKSDSPIKKPSPPKKAEKVNIFAL